jgi:hypothetical protein
MIDDLKEAIDCGSWGQVLYLLSDDPKEFFNLLSTKHLDKERFLKLYEMAEAHLQKRFGPKPACDSLEPENLVITALFLDAGW